MRPAPRVRFRACARMAGIDSKSVREVVERVWRLYAGPPGKKIEVVLMAEEEHTALHARFLDDPSSTDVMAFPYGDEDLFGEVLVNRDVAVAEARNRRKDAVDEVLLYVAHGALHLIGFRDDTAGGRAEMLAAERRVCG